MMLILPPPLSPPPPPKKKNTKKTHTFENNVYILCLNICILSGYKLTTVLRSGILFWVKAYSMLGPLGDNNNNNPGVRPQVCYMWFNFC